MGFRFQKRIKLFKGVTINLSKSGVSTSVGARGARVTLGHGKTRTTVGLPGSGISHTSVTSNRATNTGVGDSISGLVIVIALMAAVYFGIKLFL